MSLVDPGVPPRGFLHICRAETFFEALATPRDLLSHQSTGAAELNPGGRPTTEGPNVFGLLRHLGQVTLTWRKNGNQEAQGKDDDECAEHDFFWG